MDNLVKHIVIVKNFSTAFDLCSILATLDDLTFTVNTRVICGKIDPESVEYIITYMYNGE